MAALCHHFVQNAWKKDLCSNCFKSKEEHDNNAAGSGEGKTRYPVGMYPSRSHSWRHADTKPQGILKDGQVRRSKKSAVHFPAEESQVIGFGGDECYSSDGEDTFETEEAAVASEDDGEEERALQKLTRTNTDFNTVTTNLSGTGDTKRTYTQLMLGKPLTDAEGRRKTLQVSVTPFGGQEDPNASANCRKSKLLHERPTKKIAQTSLGKYGDIPNEKSGDVVLKSVVRSSEPQRDNGNSTSGLPHQNSREILLKSFLKQSDTAQVAGDEDSNTSEVETSPSKPSLTTMKSASRETTKVQDTPEGKVSRIPVVKSRVSPEKFKLATRTLAFNGRSDLLGRSEEMQPKPAVRKNSHESMKNAVKKDSTNLVVKDEVLSKDVGQDNVLKVGSKSSEERLTNPVLTNESTILGEMEEVAKETRHDQSSSDVVVETHNLEVRPDEFVVPPAAVESKSDIGSEKKPQSLTVENVSEESPATEETYKKLSDDDDFVMQTEPVETVTALSVRRIEGEPAVKMSLSKVELLLETDVLLKEKDVDMFCVEESRELAGEPDGRADPDELTEPPALPRSPPPVIDPRPSFLHALTQVTATRKLPGDKPKIPVKPSPKVLQSTPRRHIVPQSPKLHEEQCEVAESAVLDTSRAHKRQAPKPPPTPVEETTCPLFTRNPSIGLIKSCSPVAREKEKRERASSCSPKLRGDLVVQSPSGAAPCPEPAPRRSLSLSVESLSSVTLNDTQTEPEKKKPSNGRARFSLRKFLRFGASKEDKTATITDVPRLEDVSALPVPRPRLEIIHPLELNGANVEVVRGDASNVRRSLEDSSSTSSSSSDNKDGDISLDSGTSQSSTLACMAARPTKPPPPPRNQSLDAWGKTLEGLNKPARPPPPKSAELLRQQKQPTGHVQPMVPTNNLYANLGEVRSGLTPNKPQRTSSIRDANLEGPKRRAAVQTEDSGYESVELGNGKHVLETMENVYECVMSACECDMAKPVHYNGLQQRRSEGSMDTSPDYLTFRGSFKRSTSLPYCGSETESDIYSPYSFYGSEDAGDDVSEWSPTSGHPWKTSKLRLRKGRSVVHKNLEDNYGAVIVANHEALAQVMEQVNVGAVVPPVLRGLKTASNLRWTDFTLLDDSRCVVVGKRTFHSALWGTHGVTLSVTMDQSSVPSRGSFSLCPLTEFSDLVPAHYLPGQPKDKMDLTQACVLVLTRMHVDTIQTYGTVLRGKVPEDEQWRDGSFVLLQLVNGLKTLQAQGIEEAPLTSFVLCREDRDPQPRLCILQVRGDGGSLCQCALAAVRELLPSAPLTPLVSELLQQERAVTLSRVKSVLEFSLWGPADVALGASSSDRELVLQRWLDLERATVLHGLVRTRVELTAFEECHLLFLVRTSAKMMCEASVLLDTRSAVPETTSF